MRMQLVLSLMMMLGAGAFTEAQNVGDVPMGKILRRIAASQIACQAMNRVRFAGVSQQLSIHEPSGGGDGWAATRATDSIAIAASAAP